MAGYRSAPGRDKKMFQMVYAQFANRVEKTVDSKFTASLYLLWGSSASTLALELIQRLKPFRRAWGRGDKEKAKLITQVCLYPLVSAWYSTLGKRPDDLEVRAAKVRELSGALELMDGFGEDRIREFFDLDTQWDYENDPAGEKSESASFAYGLLLTSKIARAIGLGEFIDWGKQTLPIHNLKEFAFVNKDRPCGDLKMYDVAAAMLDTVYKMRNPPSKDAKSTAKQPVKAK